MCKWCGGKKGKTQKCDAILVCCVVFCHDSRKSHYMHNSTSGFVVACLFVFYVCVFLSRIYFVSGFMIRSIIPFTEKCRKMSMVWQVSLWCNVQILLLLGNNSTLWSHQHHYQLVVYKSVIHDHLTERFKLESLNLEWGWPGWWKEVAKKEEEKKERFSYGCGCDAGNDDNANNDDFGKWAFIAQLASCRVSNRNLIQLGYLK